MADDSNFGLKLVGRTSSVENIVRTVTVSTGASGSLAVKASMARISTEWAARGRATMFLRVPKTPAFLALAGRRPVGSNCKKFTTKID